MSDKLPAVSATNYKVLWWTLLGEWRGRKISFRIFRPFRQFACIGGSTSQCVIGWSTLECVTLAGEIQYYNPRPSVTLWCVGPPIYVLLCYYCNVILTAELHCSSLASGTIRFLTRFLKGQGHASGSNASKDKTRRTSG